MSTRPKHQSPRTPSASTAVRLQKVLADTGLGSRREIEDWIRVGRVRVNGRLARLGDRIGPADRIRVDGKAVKRRSARSTGLRVIAYNKPEGELVTRHDPKGRRTLFGRLPRLKTGRWIAVGRLDINSSGLLLLTNNGELANRLMHPAQALEREYAVRTLGEVSAETLRQLTHGILLQDGPGRFEARFEEVVESGGEGANRWFHVLLCEGRNREVRRLWEAVGCRVSRLKRVRFGNVILGPRVFAGHWRDLTPDELTDLLALAGMERPPAPARRTGKIRPPARQRQAAVRSPSKPERKPVRAKTPGHRPRVR